MAAPPPAFNPDTRPLPDGCITRYDENYRAWYYVDTRTRPPRSSWEHPLGPLSPPPPTTNYTPPSNPPPNRANYGSNAGSPPFSPQPAQQAQQYNQPPSFGGGFNTQDQPRNFQQQYQQPPYGGPPGNYGNPGNPGWPQQGWQQQPPAQLGYQSQPASQAIQQPPRSGRTHGGGIGLGGAAALGVGGLVGGALLANAFEDHEDRVREDGYEQGYDDNQNNDFGGGGNFDGGDW